MITRRKAALAIAAVSAMTTGQLKAEEVLGLSTSNGFAIANGKPVPYSLFFDLSTVKRFAFAFEGKTVTFTPEEMFKALSE